MFRKLCCVSILVAVGSFLSPAQSKKAARADGEKLITALARSKNMPPVVGDDGVFVNTLLDARDGMPPEVRRILDLEEKAIPLLIAHLDDTRLTRMSYCCNEQPRLTVGDACLNILSEIVKPAPPMFDRQCVAEEDDQSMCLNETYAFEMSSFMRRGKLRVAGREVRTAQRNWLKAYREKKIQYQGY